MQEEVFETKHASIKQCELTGSFLLTFEREEFAFKLCDLITFRKKIMALNLTELLESSAPDIEIIHLPSCDRFLVLSLKEILEFRELLNGTFNILALNSSIKRILRKSVFNF
ncbi:MAG: hypothetical protein OXH57_06970 [Ekhidna sp.]|nr:hypothetical protein [Ekhidna sp.]